MISINKIISVISIFSLSAFGQDNETSNISKLITSNKTDLKTNIDMKSLSISAKEGRISSTIHFKLSKDHKLVKKGKASKLAEKVAKNLNCDTPSRMFRHAGKHEKSHKVFGLDMWYETECSHDMTNKKNAAIETFTKLSNFLDEKDKDGVVYVEPEYEKLYTRTMNDPLLDNQGHYDAINLKGAWDTTTGNPNVIVQVIDDGIDISHTDLQKNIWKNPGEICGNGVDDDGNDLVDDCYGWNFADDNNKLVGNSIEDDSHGTHCAGTIAAVNNNQKGVCGVAGGDGSSNSGVKLMVGRMFGDKKIGGEAKALIYGADHGARISSNSWGFTTPGVYEQSIHDAIDYFNSKGGIVVFAAGNNGKDQKKISSLL